jgi:hypothetical protein
MIFQLMQPISVTTALIGVLLVLLISIYSYFKVVINISNLSASFYLVETQLS